jgi:hypothetical protein
MTLRSLAQRLSEALEQDRRTSPRQLELTLVERVS